MVVSQRESARSGSVYGAENALLRGAHPIDEALLATYDERLLAEATTLQHQSVSASAKGADCASPTKRVSVMLHHEPRQYLVRIGGDELAVPAEQGEEVLKRLRSLPPGADPIVTVSPTYASSGQLGVTHLNVLSIDFIRED